MMFNRLFYRLLLLIFISLKASGLMAQPVEKISIFANGKWMKIETSASGIHKISYSWLKNIGFSHPEKVKIFGSRNEMMSLWNANPDENSPKQIPVLRLNEGAGIESILFFVPGPLTWKFDPILNQYIPSINQCARSKSWFFLTEDIGSDLQLSARQQTPGNPDIKITDYDEVRFWGEENINLIESGSQWYTALLLGGNTQQKSFQFPDRMDKEPIIINAYAAARSSSPTRMDVLVNGNVLGNILFYPIQVASEQDFASTGASKVSGVLTGTDINLSIKYNGTASDQSWFDYATIQVRRSLQYRGTSLLFKDSRSFHKSKFAEYQISGATPGLQLWEVTNPSQPVQTAFQLISGQLIFRSATDTLRSFLLFDPLGVYPGISKVEEVKNADLPRMVVPQFLILSNSLFMDQANRLAEFHRSKEAMSVGVVNVESVFNELSGGYPDIPAIRNFVRDLYGRKSASNGSTLKYLLLFGKGTCDPVHDPSENNPNWIPSYESENSLNAVNTFVTDDFYGLLDPDEGAQKGSVDIGIGRIPCVSPAEATIAVDKIIHYHDAQTLGDWRNNIAFIGDDEDNNIHVNDSETLASLVNRRNPEFRTSKIYLDAYPQILNPEERYPDVTEAIRRSVQTGDLIVNYIGHASEDGLAHEKVLTIRDIDAWTNKDRLPLFVTATCEFSRWDMIMKRSAGEHLLFHPSGGTIALLSTTRLVYSASNFEINKSFFNHVFERDEKGEPLRLGDLIRLVKNENSGSINTLKFCLLGDPALRLNYPEYHCRNLEINHKPVQQFGGTLSPLSLVTISGEIQDGRSQKMDQFNGTMSATIFDQPAGKKTLGNGGLPPFSYSVQDNILFNGNVPVKNGAFSYSFVVPKDVNYNKEAGLIRYYFNNGQSDANGSFSGIHFNGNEILPATDNNGPTIRLYLENENFREGGSVSSTPLLLVYLEDVSGINTSGIGIGHDITLELDGQSADPAILNDFYKTDLGNWKTGTIYYPLSTLAVGPHHLKLKVWDNANNSSTASVGFNVSKELKFTGLYNFPNPFSEQTRFVITHNRYDELFDVNLEIVDLAGRKVSSSRQSLISRGYEISDLYWDPRQWNAAPVGGVYLYRITLTDKEGFRSTKSGRMIWKK